MQYCTVLLKTKVYLLFPPAHSKAAILTGHQDIEPELTKCLRYTKITIRFGRTGRELNSDETQWWVV